jgi:serine/threonine-protein kinase
MVGTHFGSFTVIRKLGEGGMGAVYLAAHRHLDRLAAVKVLLPELSTNDEVVRRFFTEARATSLIDHPGIVEILDCDTLPSGQAYIVMEFLRGEGLASCIRRLGDLRDDFPSVLAIAEQMAGALAAAHAKGIIHRDLKPDNVHLIRAPQPGAPPRVKILDFGIAKLAEAGKGSKTRTGSLLGTPLYMSPEQCRSAANVDARSDIYSLGCILFEMVCGRPPFLHEGFGDLVVAHISEPPPDIMALQPTTPRPLADLIYDLLAKAREDRPANMQMVAERLRTLQPICPPAHVPLVLDEPPQQPIPTFIATPVSSHPGAREETAVMGGDPRRPDSQPGANRLGGDPRRPDSQPGGTRLLPERKTTLGESASEIGLHTIPTERTRPQSRGPGTWIALGILLAAGAGGGGYLALRPNNVQPEGARDHAARPEPPPVEAPPPAALPPRPSRPDDDMVTVRVNGTPAGTEVSVDGNVRQLPLQLPRGSGRHVLTFKAPGYQEARHEIESDRDLDLTIALQYEQHEHHAPPTHAHHHATTAEGGAPATPPVTPGPPPKKGLSPITDL